MWVALAGSVKLFVRLVSPLVSLHVSASAGSAESLSPLVSPLSPFIFVFLLVFPWSLFMWAVSVRRLYPFSLSSSRFVSLHVSGLGRILGTLVSTCLPLSHFMWVALAGSLGHLSRLVSACFSYVGGLGGVSGMLVSLVDPGLPSCMWPWPGLERLFPCLPSCGWPSACLPVFPLM